MASWRRGVDQTHHLAPPHLLPLPPVSHPYLPLYPPPHFLKDFLRLEQGNLTGVSTRRQKLFLARHGWELAIDGHGKYNYYFPPTDTTASNRRDAIRVTLDRKNGDDKMTAAGALGKRRNRKAPSSSSSSSSTPPPPPPLGSSSPSTAATRTLRDRTPSKSATGAAGIKGASLPSPLPSLRPRSTAGTVGSKAGTAADEKMKDAATIKTKRGGRGGDIGGKSGKTKTPGVGRADGGKLRKKQPPPVPTVPALAGDDVRALVKVLLGKISKITCRTTTVVWRDEDRIARLGEGIQLTAVD